MFKFRLQQRIARDWLCYILAKYLAAGPLDFLFLFRLTEASSSCCQ